jgi:predicted DsbA family dithiol-disulfide isomerase
MSKTLKIDFVSDVACPWCAVGLASFEQALKDVGDDISVELSFQPFELNPTMAPEGADAAEYLMAKYGMPREQLAVNRQRIVDRGAEVGFRFGERKHVWNTFDAHRLLHWAGVEGAPGAQHALKRALLQAYHGEGRNPAAPEVLLEAATAAGLDTERARTVIAGKEFTDEVREAEQFWQQAGINAVPAVVINRRHLVSGGQPPEVFAQALRKIADEA